MNYKKFTKASNPKINPVNTTEQLSNPNNNKHVGAVYQFEVIKGKPAMDWPDPSQIIYSLSVLTKYGTFKPFEDLKAKNGSIEIELNVDLVNHTCRIKSENWHTKFRAALVWKRNSTVYVGMNYDRANPIIIEIVTVDRRIRMFHSITDDLNSFVRRFTDENDDEMQDELNLSRTLIVRNIINEIGL